MLGYEEIKNNGSRRKFFNKEKKLVINLHQPHPGNIVKKCYVEQVVDHLKSNGLIGNV
ncbi:MAG: type II toxin-antitoxin system HicA family toxin [Gammaproteobacteria bacterium]